MKIILKLAFTFAVFTTAQTTFAEQRAQDAAASSYDANIDWRQAFMTQERDAINAFLHTHNFKKRLQGTNLDDDFAAICAVIVYNWTPLHLAAKTNRADIAELVLNRGAAINAQDVVGWTPLHLAAKEGHSTIVRALLDHGAETNIKTNDGKTLLQVASKKEIVDLLRQHTAKKSCVLL